jgi:hypothetical protein
MVGSVTTFGGGFGMLRDARYDDGGDTRGGDVVSGDSGSRRRGSGSARPPRGRVINRRARRHPAAHRRRQKYETTDPKRYERELKKSRNQLFVATTRARDTLRISWPGRPSPFLPL